jgi:hypothetical protein
MSDLAKVDLLRRVTDVFNRHDLDAIMAAFSDDCVFECRAGLIPGASDSWARTRCGRTWRTIRRDSGRALRRRRALCVCEPRCIGMDTLRNDD